MATVTLGDQVMIGPGVQLLTASHPMSPTERVAGKELGLPIVIEAKVWLGGNVVVCPGVRIGEGLVFAAGNPCRVIRPLAP